MKKLLLTLMLLPIMALAQTSEVYINLTNASGTPIKGDAVTRGFEKWIQALTIASGGKNNSQVSFTMNISGSAAELKKAMASDELLPTGQVSVMQAGTSTTQYTIKMERIQVLACTETMGCNGVMTTSATLQPVRIGWTYYSTGKGGLQTVSNKYGYDLDTGGAWNNF
ncbi:type VI secretion system tube protein Hcp [Mariniflexile sp.]|uniref:type VI secretion system tube protein Hcp n=1 Tax=Mariniflexile sp. TaxID=1979402 RepID=UPI00404758C9